MTLPDVDSLATLGGALNNLSAVENPLTDRDAGGANQAYADAAAMTHTMIRAWAHITLNGSSTPTLVAHDSVWGNAVGVAPVLAHTGTGVVTVTWPTTVLDEIPNGAPGYTGAHTINLRAGWGNLRVVATLYETAISITAPNVATLNVYNSGGSLADVGVATDFDVFMI
jgi:hypothetical protein